MTFLTDQLKKSLKISKCHSTDRRKIKIRFKEAFDEVNIVSKEFFLSSLVVEHRFNWDDRRS
jgi:hypothetical protein